MCHLTNQISIYKQNEINIELVANILCGSRNYYTILMNRPMIFYLEEEKKILKGNQ